MSTRRCGVTSLGGQWGCCRPLLHDGPHCAHATDTMTGTPGVTVVGRSLLGVTFGRCDGTKQPTGDRIRATHDPGNRWTRTDLIPPTEGETP